jgi:hypothetical protein
MATERGLGGGRSAPRPPSARGLVALVAGLLAVVALALVVLLATRSAEPAGPAVDPLGGALARVPADATTVAVVRTDADDPQVRALGDLAGRFQGSAIGIDLLLARLPVPARIVEALRGSPLVVAITPRGWVAATVPQDPDALRTALGGGDRLDTSEATIVLDGPVAVVSPQPALVAAATDRTAPPGPFGTPRAFGAATAGLPRPAVVLAAFRDTATLVGSASPLPGAQDVRAVLGGARLGAGAAALQARDTGLRLTLRAALAGPPPVATGAAPARPQAFARPVVAGLRDPAAAVPALRRLAARRAPDALAAYDSARDALARVRTDLDGLLLRRLVGIATLALDGRTATLTGRLSDPGPLATALQRIALIPAVAFDLAGADGLDVDREDGGAYAVVQDGRPVVRVLVDGDRVAVSTDPGADLRVAARRPVAPGPPVPGAGALAARLDARPLRATLFERLGLPQVLTGALDPLGSPTLGLAVEPGRAQVVVDVPIG